LFTGGSVLLLLPFEPVPFPELFPAAMLLLCLFFDSGTPTATPIMVAMISKMMKVLNA
jgi:hypothetical protein